MRGATAVPMLGKRPPGAARAGRSAFLPTGSAAAVDRPMGAAHAGITFALVGLLTVSTAVAIRGDDDGHALESLRSRSASAAGVERPAAVPLSAGAVTTSPPTPSAAHATAAPTASRPSAIPVPARRRAVQVALPPRSPSPTPPAPRSAAVSTAASLVPENVPPPSIPPPAENPSPVAPPPQPVPDPRPLAAASLSAAPGTPADVVVRVAATPQPHADVTVGSTQVIGDAPPSQTTGASVGGTLVPEASAAVSAAAFT